MVVNNIGRPRQSLQREVMVTDQQVQRARVIIESMMPAQAGNMDAVLLAGVAHALAVQDSQHQALAH